jgi:hypothetical protein
MEEPVHSNPLNYGANDSDRNRAPRQNRRFFAGKVISRDQLETIVEIQKLELAMSQYEARVEDFGKGTSTADLQRAAKRVVAQYKIFKKSLRDYTRAVVGRFKTNCLDAFAEIATGGGTNGSNNGGSANRGQRCYAGEGSYQRHRADSGSVFVSNPRNPRMGTTASSILRTFSVVRYSPKTLCLDHSPRINCHRSGILSASFHRAGNSVIGSLVS